MTLTVGTLGPATGNTITINANQKRQWQGSIVQTTFVRSDVRTTYTSTASGNGTVITQLRLTITPQRPDSIIWTRWTVFYEVQHDTVFTVLRDGALIGYNRDRGNVRWSGILCPLYDNDYNSTPQNSTINWFDPAGNTTERYYDLAIRSSSNANRTFGFNRTVGSTGQNDYEAGVSWGIVREISG